LVAWLFSCLTWIYKRLWCRFHCAAEVPIVQSIREAGDYGRPAAMQTGSIVASVLKTLHVK
jgi:hypothetical protein